MEKIDSVNMEQVTTGDCIDQYEYKHMRTIINDGKVIGFEEE